MTLRPFHRLFASRHGNVLMLTGLSILVLFAIAGAGVDFGRQQLVRMKLQNASDAAAIAAAAMKEGTSTDERRNLALRYFNLNYPTSFLGVARPTPNIEIAADKITVDASAEMNANFVSNVGVKTLTAQGRTVVNPAKNSNSIYDVLLVMDNSGSMAEVAAAPSYASADQAVARPQIVGICNAQMRPFFELICNNNPNPTLPDGTTTAYNTSAVCKFSAPHDWCDHISDNPDSSTPPNQPINGYGLIGNSRLNALRSAALTFVDTILHQGQAGSRIGLISWSSDVLSSHPLTNDATILTTFIKSMGASGSTNPVAAMNKASDLTHDFAPDHVKAVVLLTDGVPTISQTDPQMVNDGGVVHPLDGSGCTGNPDHFCDGAVSQTLPICSQLKNSGVDVYTIAFGPEVNTGPHAAQAQKFLKDCASPDTSSAHFFLAPDGSTLQQAFGAILKTLGKIRISE